MPLYEGYPSRIAKQTIYTIIASSQAELIEQRPDLHEYVLNRDAIAPPGTIKLATYICPTRTGRSTGVAVTMHESRKSHLLAEFSLAPFGYVLTFEGEPHDSRPVDISWFTQCGYEERRRVRLDQIPILPTHEAFPGDYRTKDEIRCEIIQNVLTEQGQEGARVEADRIMSSGNARAFFEANDISWYS